MDERVRGTVETYEDNAETYASVHDDRSAVAEMVREFLDAVAASSGDTSAERGPGERGSTSRRARVLDVGCGPGWESAAFADHGFDVVSFDLTRSFLDQTRERVPAAVAVRGDMRDLPFATGCFDGLWACASLLHVPRDAVVPTLREFDRVLVPGGVASVSLQRADRPALDPEDGDDFTNPYDADERHFERYEPAEVRDLFTRAGFEVTGADADERWIAVVARNE